MKLTIASLGLMVAALCALSRPAAAMQPGAAVAGPGAIYIQQADLSRQMMASIAKQADPALATIGVTDDHSIHEVHRSKPGPPAIHPGATELHFILSGSGLLVSGGRIVTAADGKKEVEGGVARTVRKGDAIIIPPGTPHWYKQINGSISYLEVRFVTPAAGDTPK
jgi:mannose-6-phosphate isomerase-like protein (cupin superfamily)